MWPASVSENCRVVRFNKSAPTPPHALDPFLALTRRCKGAELLFRRDLVARDIYLLIASTGYFYTSNRHTLTAFLGEPLESPEATAHWEEFVIETVLRTVRADEAQDNNIPPHDEDTTKWQKSQPAQSRARSSSRT